MTDEPKKITGLLDAVGPVTPMDLEIVSLITRLVSGFSVLRISFEQMQKYPGDPDKKLAVVAEHLKEFEDDLMARVNDLIERISREQTHG